VFSNAHGILTVGVRRSAFIPTTGFEPVFQP
jgi:hypothetical protein